MVRIIVTVRRQHGKIANQVLLHTVLLLTFEDYRLDWQRGQVGDDFLKLDWNSLRVGDVRDDEPSHVREGRDGLGTVPPLDQIPGRV